jgi:sulfatase maturation enzyme AslB (radical SAM superfamily)
MKEKISDGFCVLPFFGIEYPENTHCCLLKKNYNINQVRLEMLAGKKPDACSACWSLEEKNLISDRQLKNMALDVYWDRDIRFIENDCHAGKYYINHYKISSSNLCNAACTTCNRDASSYWGKIENIVSLEIDEKEKFDNMIDYKTAVAINFTGGESLLSKTNFYILEKLLNVSNTNCFIQFTTNGSVKLTKSQTDILKRFKNLNFGVSIDGVGAVFEYMRWPLQWENIVENINVLRQITNNVSATTTTSNLNVMYFPALLRWLENNGLQYHYNPVYNPSYFRPQALPVDVKLKIRKMHDGDPFIELQLNRKHIEKDDIDFNQCLVEIERQDKLKKIDIRNYIPEFCQLTNI